jgi:magnesium transporter
MSIPGIAWRTRQTSHVHGTLTTDGPPVELTAEAAAAALSGSAFFWIEADASEEPDEIQGLLADVFKFHPLAVEDADHFGQRPKIDEYDGYDYMVVHGALDGLQGTEEVHIFFSDRYVVILHQGTCVSLEQVRHRIAQHPLSVTSSPSNALVYLVVDALVDSYFPVLSTFDDRIDELEDEILKQPTEAQLGELFQMKRQLLTVRKVVTPQRDMFATLTAGIITLPGSSPIAATYFRDLYDHLIRISDLVDGYRDLLSGVMDTHISTVSNRLNLIMKQLAIIATIFLPLSFLTGFFGQNFAYLVTNIRSPWAFAIWGIGLELAAVVALGVLFKKRGWLGGPTN